MSPEGHSLSGVSGLSQTQGIPSQFLLPPPHSPPRFRVNAFEAWFIEMS